jgi:dynein heavy chain
LRFKGGKVQAKFGTTEKNEVVVDAEYVDDSTIKCKAPNYEQFGAMPVDVKVSINGEGWTVNKIRYSYFANTAARNCLAFGPGLLETGVAGVEMPFLIQARDTLNEPRTSGGDAFTVKVVSADGKLEGSARLKDCGDGKYQVHYSVPQPGSYAVTVLYAELGGSELVPIRGSPFTVRCEDAWVKHRVAGAAPARRKGATLTAVGEELVMYGGDSSGVAVCVTGAGEWKWSIPAIQGSVVPPDRSQHSAVLVKDQLVVFGGSSLTNGAELADMFWLKKQPNGSWAWGCPESHMPYIR